MPHDEYSKKKLDVQAQFTIGESYLYSGINKAFKGKQVTVTGYEKKGGIEIVYNDQRGVVSPFSLAKSNGLHREEPVPDVLPNTKIVTVKSSRRTSAPRRPMVEVPPVTKGIVENPPVPDGLRPATIIRNGHALPPPPPPDAATLIRLAPVIETPYPEITWAAWFVFRFRNTCPRADRRALARSTDIVAAVNCLVTAPLEQKQALYPLITYIIARRDVATATAYAVEDQKRVLDALGHYGVPRPTAIRDIQKMREVVEWSKHRWVRFTMKHAVTPTREFVNA
jgi:hypothetical protein